MPQRGLLLSDLLVEPRQMVVRVGEPLIDGDRLTVGGDRRVSALQVFESGAQIARGGGVLMSVTQRLLILESSFFKSAPLLEQPAQVYVGVRISGVERQRPAIGILRITGLDRLELLTETEPVIGRELFFARSRVTRMTPRDRSGLLGQLADPEI